MNHRQQKVHAAMVFTLVAVLPAGVHLALDARESIPTMSSLPPAMRGGVAAPGRLKGEGPSTPLGDLGLRVQVESGKAHVRGALDRAMPGPLLYWTAATPGTRALPDDAVFLGRLDDAGGGPFPLPPAAKGASSQPAGALVVFSLGHGQVEAWASLADGTHGGPP